MRKTVFPLFTVAFAIIVLAACSHKQNRFKIGISQCSEDIWRSRQNAELRMEANFHEGIELCITAAHDNSERQIQQIDSLVKSGIDLLIVAPNQLQSVSAAIDRAYDKGIPVIVFERKTDSPKYTAFVSADNYEMGRQMGDYVSRRLPKGGRVMEIQGLKGSSPAEERHRGFRDAIEQHPQINVVATLQGDWTEETAYQKVKAYKENLDDIDMVFGHNDRTAMGARKAFSETQSHLPLFCGIDGLPGENGGIQQVRDSLLDASYIYPTRGDLLLQLALNILEGKPYQKETMLTSALVTRDNAHVLLLESEEVIRQTEKLDKLQEKASGYMQQIDSQHTIILLTIGSALLLLLLAIGIWLYQRQRVRIHHERTQMEREQLDFYTQVSHQLRTPLTLIEGPLSQLRETDDIHNASEKTKELFDIVGRNTTQLTILINKMLDVQVGGKPAEVTFEHTNTTITSPTTTKQENKIQEPSDDIPDILIVDDNDDIRTYLNSILGGKYHVSQAADGKMGLEKAKSEVPDLIISDVMMPVMNGLEFCQQIKTDFVTSHIPVILLTARALNKHQIEGYESGADAYITKPFQADLLLARISNLLKSRIQLRNLWSSNEQKENKAKAPKVEVKENAFILRFKAVVEEKMADSDLSVEDIGADMNLSRVQLYRKVKALTGCSPVDLLRKARLSEAHRLLMESDLSVSEIAYKVGFTSPSYFTKCFKEEYGKVPGDARQ